MFPMHFLLRKITYAMMCHVEDLCKPGFQVVSNDVELISLYIFQRVQLHSQNIQQSATAI
jgi:hypothetical protein